MLSSAAPPTSAYFEIATNAAGQIDYWNIQLRDEPSPGNVRSITTGSIAPFTGQDSGVIQVSINDVITFDTGYVNSQPGSWNVSAVPEPSICALLACGSLGSLAFRYRKPR